MTAQEILDKVKIGADARFDETVARLLITLRQRHTHNSWRKECYCEYCRFILHTYTDEKLRLHKLKVRLRIAEDCSIDMNDGHVIAAAERLMDQKQKVMDLKNEKKQLQTNVL